MKIVLKRPFADVFLCMLWSVILLPITLTDIEGTIRIILGLPFLLFIPGYLLGFALFPLRKTNVGIDTIERIALSFALSLAVVPIIGLVLNYTPWGLQIVPIFLSLFGFIIGVGAIVLFLWYQTPSEERLSTTLTVSLPKPKKNLDGILIIILVASLIAAPASVTYVMVTSKTENPFTEFYLLNPDGIVGGYQTDLAIGENASIIIGVANHEHKTIDYNIEIWLVNQTTVYSDSTNEKEMKYDHMWFIGKINTSLIHTPVDIDKPWEPQWEYNYTFNISRKGDFKLFFLLFTTPTEDYSFEQDYKDIAEQKISNAYRITNLPIFVTHLPKINDVSASPPTVLQGGFVNISCKVFDADGVSEVFLNISGPYGIHQNFSIKGNNTGLIYYSNRTYSVVGDYLYYIWVNDTASNTRISSVWPFIVTDLPKINDVSASPPTVLQGGFVNISCKVFDVDGVDEVFLNIINPDGNVENFSIISNSTDDVYYCNRTYSVVGDYLYYIWVNDTHSNFNISDIRQFSVMYP
jgi:uncharacterized membrane protein